MSQKSTTQINSDIISTCPDNNTGDITPAILRARLQDINESALNNTTTSAQTIDGECDFVGGLKSNSINVLTGNRAYAHGYIVDSALQTTFAALNTPYIVNFGTAFLSNVVSGFTISTAGRFTYTGTPTITANITATINAVMVGVGGSTTRRYKFWIAKNGTAITQAVMKVQFSGAQYDNCVVDGSYITLATGDYLELYVSAIDATSTLNVDTVAITLEGF